MANPPSSPEFDWKMYRYIPSLAGALVALSIFFIMTLLHLYQFLRSRNRIILFVVIGASGTPPLPSPHSHRPKAKHSN